MLSRPPHGRAGSSDMLRVSPALPPFAIPRLEAYVPVALTLRQGPVGLRPAAGLEALKPRCTSWFDLAFCACTPFLVVFLPCGGRGRSPGGALFTGFLPCAARDKPVRCSLAPSPHTGAKGEPIFRRVKGTPAPATADPSAAGPTSTHQLTLLRTARRSRGPTMAAEMDAPALNGGVNGVSEV